MSWPWLAYEGRRWLWNRPFVIGCAIVLSLVVWPPAEQGLPHSTPSARVARAGMTLGWLWWFWLAWVGTRFGSRWSRGESAWIVPAGRTARQACRVAWLASVVASLGLASVALVAAFALGPAQFPTWRVQQIAPLEPAPALGPEQRMLAQWPKPWRAAPWEAQDQISLWVHSTGASAPTAQATLHVLTAYAQLGDAQPGEAHESAPFLEPNASASQERIDGVRRLQASAPLDADPTGWMLVNAGPGELGLLAGRGLTWLQPESLPRFALGLMGLYIWSCFGIAAGALLLGSWMRPWLAMALLLALAVGWWQGAAGWTGETPFGATSLSPSTQGPLLRQVTALWRGGLGPPPWSSAAIWIPAALSLLACWLVPRMVQRGLRTRGGTP